MLSTQNNKNILWSAREAEAITGGVCTGDWQASGIAVCLKEVRPGDLFVAQQNEDIGRAFAAGAVAAMVPSLLYEDAGDLPLLKVASPYEALCDLARTARFRTHAQVIAVQGSSMRRAIAGHLKPYGRVHEGGRLLSLDMANMPEDAGFGVLSLAPMVRPDIAVILKMSDNVCDSLFESMPASGTVIACADLPDYPHIVARARARGIRTILSFGLSDGADAQIGKRFETKGGYHAVLKILDEEIPLTLGSSLDEVLGLAAALLIVKMLGRPVRENDFAAHDPAGGVQCLTQARLKRNSLYSNAVFRVSKLIDLGLGPQTAVLDNFAGSVEEGVVKAGNKWNIPHRIRNLNLMLTSRDVPSVSDPRAVIRRKYKGQIVEPVAADVVSPGDFLVFGKQANDEGKAVLSEVLRMVP